MTDREWLDSLKAGDEVCEDNWRGGLALHSVAEVDHG